MPLEPFAPLVSRLSTTISTPSDWSGHPRPPEPPLPANRPTSEGASSSPSSTGQGRGPSQHPHLGRPLYFQLNLITPYLLPPRPAPATPRARAAVARDGRFLPVFTPARLPSSKSGGETPLGWLTHDSTLTQVIDLLTYIPPTSGHILGNYLASEDLSIQGPTGSSFFFFWTDPRFFSRQYGYYPYIARRRAFAFFRSVSEEEPSFFVP